MVLSEKELELIVKDARVLDQVLAVLDAIKAVVGHARTEKFDVRESEDGSACLEWREPRKRLVFTIEKNATESGWHVVTSRDVPNPVMEYGTLFTSRTLEELMERGPKLAEDEGLDEIVSRALKLFLAVSA